MRNSHEIKRNNKPSLLPSDSHRISIQLQKQQGSKSYGNIVLVKYLIYVRNIAITVVEKLIGEIIIN